MCLAGSIEVLFDTRKEIVTAGETLIVNPGQRHRCRFGVTEPKSNGFTLIVRPLVLQSVIESMALPYADPARYPRFAGKAEIPEALPLVFTLMDEVHRRQRGFNAMIEILVRQILIYLLRSWPVETVSHLNWDQPPQLPWLHMHRATEFMNAHGKGDFRLSELCNAVGVSSSRFIPLFKNSSGVSPHTYYNALIIFKACRLLHSDQLSTKEVAYSLGFRNVSHFCSLFHQVTGVTPKSNREPLSDPLSALYPTSYLR